MQDNLFKKRTLEIVMSISIKEIAIIVISLSFLKLQCLCIFFLGYLVNIYVLIRMPTIIQWNMNELQIERRFKKPVVK